MWAISLQWLNANGWIRDLMQKAMNFNDVAIASDKRSDYRIHFWYLSNNDAINIMNSSNVNEKSGSLQVFLSYIKNDWGNVSSNKQRNNTK